MEHTSGLPSTLKFTFPMITRSVIAGVWPYSSPLLNVINVEMRPNRFTSADAPPIVFSSTSWPSAIG